MMKRFFAKILLPYCLFFACQSWAAPESEDSIEESVEIDGVSYLRDDDGNFIRADIVKARTAKKRKPVRNRKFGTPHPAAWTPDTAAAEESSPVTAAENISPAEKTARKIGAESGAISISSSAEKIVGLEILNGGVSVAKCDLPRAEKSGKSLKLSLPQGDLKISAMLLGNDSDASVVVEIAVEFRRKIDAALAADGWTEDCRYGKIRKSLRDSGVELRIFGAASLKLTRRAKGN